MVGRGERSGIGVHGFVAGGFLVDAGKRTAQSLATPILRATVPEPWRFVLLRPHHPVRWHGSQEQNAFARPRNRQQNDAITDRLCRLALLGLIPALHEQDATAFGAALTEYNRTSGELFAQDQGGIYVSPVVAGLVREALAAGAFAAGQSSWGPTVFALAGDADHARHLVQQFQQSHSLEAIQIAAASASGATCEQLSPRPLSTD
jgi:beta-RFAP synthase